MLISSRSARLAYDLGIDFFKGLKLDDEQVYKLDDDFTYKLPRHFNVQIDGQTRPFFGKVSQMPGMMTNPVAFCF